MFKLQTGLIFILWIQAHRSTPKGILSKYTHVQLILVIR